MKNISFIFFLIIGFTHSSCTKDATSPFNLETPSPIDDEDYKIYSSIIDITSGRKILIQQQSTPIGRFRDSDTITTNQLIVNNPNFDTTIINNLNNSDKSSLQFDEKFVSLNNELRVVSKRELDFYNTEKAFIEIYSNSTEVHYFSRIAYNNDRTQAILSHSSGSVISSSSGGSSYLEKINNEWILKDSFNYWIE